MAVGWLDKDLKAVAAMPSVITLLYNADQEKIQRVLGRVARLEPKKAPAAKRLGLTVAKFDRACKFVALPTEWPPSHWLADSSGANIRDEYEEALQAALGALYRRAELQAGKQQAEKELKAAVAAAAAESLQAAVSYLILISPVEISPAPSSWPSRPHLAIVGHTCEVWNGFHPESRSEWPS